MEIGGREGETERLREGETKGRGEGERSEIRDQRSEIRRQGVVS